MPKDNQKELFYWIDENDNELGSITREEAHSGSKKIHRSVAILLVNNKDQVLLQKRSQQKDTYPGHWTVSASGHVTYGQTYREAAIRETEEEIGILPKKITYIGDILYVSDQEKEIGKIYLADYRGEKIVIDTAEVEEVRWVDKKSLKDFDKEHKLTPVGKQALEVVGWY